MNQLADEKKHQVGTKLALSGNQVEVLDKCKEDCFIVDLMQLVGRSDRTKFRDQVLKPLIEEGFLLMTIPDKPTSSKQKYRLTDKGKAMLKNLRKKDTKK